MRVTLLFLLFDLFCVSMSFSLSDVTAERNEMFHGATGSAAHRQQPIQRDERLCVVLFGDFGNRVGTRECSYFFFVGVFPIQILYKMKNLREFNCRNCKYMNQNSVKRVMEWIRERNMKASR